jgi:hypothetical protein
MEMKNTWIERSIWALAGIGASLMLLGFTLCLITGFTHKIALVKNPALFVVAGVCVLLVGLMVSTWQLNRLHRQ